MILLLSSNQLLRSNLLRRQDAQAHTAKTKDTSNGQQPSSAIVKPDSKILRLGLRQ